MNPKIPLEIFLPPEENWSHIHAVVTNDHRGLNNGVFFLRVHEWSVWLMTACLGTEIFEPGIELEFGDQSAMGMWLKRVSSLRSRVREPSHQAKYRKDFATTLCMCLKDGSTRTLDTGEKPMVSSQILLNHRQK